MANIISRMRASLAGYLAKIIRQSVPLTLAIAAITVGVVIYSAVSGESDPQVGTNTANYVSKWDGAALVASTIYDVNGDIGIGTSGTPSAKLEVGGNIKAIGTICDSNGCIGSGSSQWSDNTAGNIYYADGNVSIGTSNPQSALQVNGYVQLSLTSGEPPAADCDETSEQGRMKIDSTAGVSLIYICTAAGWVAK